MSFEARMQALGLIIPELPKPAGHFVPAVQIGHLLFVSGQIAAVSGQVPFKGKLGGDLSIEQGQQAARIALLNVLAVIRSTTGSLDAIKRIVKLNGWVASTEGFTSQPRVIDGASLLLEEIFGEAGQHARAAIGVAELPLGAPVELELITEIQS
jgi:enamine deaminase RidA (YjgF/YER057c/UK114 family)